VRGYRVEIAAIDEQGFFDESFNLICDDSDFVALVANLDKSNFKIVKIDVYDNFTDDIMLFCKQEKNMEKGETQ
jgi:hypothetical protein